MSIFSIKKKEKLVAIFDIGSSSVSGALALIPDKKSDGIPKIIHTAHSEIPFQENLDFDRFLHLMLKSLEETAIKMAKGNRAVPKKVFCFLASPWCATQTRVISHSRNTPFMFTEKMAAELIEKELKAFENSELKKYADVGSAAEIIESKNIEISLNGYKTAKPFGKYAHEVEMTLFVSMSPKTILDLVEEKIHTFFHVSGIHFHSFVFSSFVAVRDMFPENDDFLLADIGGEITDISMVKNDVISESASFPYGKNFLIRRISSSLNKLPAEALSLLSIYVAGKLESSMVRKMEGALKKARNEWLAHFQESLSGLSSAFLPETVFLTADKDVSPWFAETIAKEEFSQYSQTRNKFNVILLEASSLRRFCKNKDGVERDPFLMLESIFINRIK